MSLWAQKSRWKHVRNHRQNWNRSDTCFRKDVPYNTTHTRESQARKRKKLTERVSVSHTLNLLRNGIILQKGHINYTQNEDILKLNFNDSIYSSKNSSNILEEVIYTISLSINDNYNVKEIIFEVNNKEIYKKSLKTIE